MAHALLAFHFRKLQYRVTETRTPETISVIHMNFVNEISHRSIVINFQEGLLTVSDKLLQSEDVTFLSLHIQATRPVM
jgi:hypothetical protein